MSLSIQGNRRGFTIIELLMTMTIIGLLANIAVPVVRDTRRRAEGAAVIGDYAVIRTGVLDFYATNNDLPQSGTLGSVPPDLVGSLPNGFTFSPSGVQYLWVRYATPVPMAGRLVIGVVMMITADPRLAEAIGSTYRGDDLDQFGALLVFMLS